jgi:hypothetical protein
MAGSLRIFKYKADDGATVFNVNLDESLTEQINGSLTAEELKPAPGVVVLPVAGRCRSVTYRSADGLYSRKGVILDPAVLNTLPGSISIRSGSGAGTDAGAAITLLLRRPRGERFSRGAAAPAPADTGQNDGDSEVAIAPAP